jgi:beta-ureidopropionase / N-carbamoyl-L-amino-acid hydrolase
VPDVSPERFAAWFDELAAIGRGPDGWNRLAWTDGEEEARRWFTRVAEGLDLAVEQDGAGNLWAVAVGGDRDRPWVAAGSHLDTQPAGGAYDGALGVVCALEAAAALRDAGAVGGRPLAVAAFVDEEGARFDTPTYGSLAISGRLDVDRALAALGDEAGRYGVDRDSLVASRAQLRRIACFLEVHVEQGRSLVDRGLALGVASVLAPRQRWRAVFTGEANHAGTTPMAGRRDALVAAAGFVLAAERAAAARPGAVATVGRIEAWPGSTNSIPGRVSASLDARALDVQTVDAIVGELRAGFPEATFTAEARSDGARFDEDMRRRLAGAADARGIPAGELPSYAGHDAGILAADVPAAMLFVRNPTGASHTPAEAADRDDCVAAAQVLTDVLADVLAEP